MASYKLLIKSSAAKELESLPKKQRIRMAAKIQALAATPRPTGCEKLSGHDLFRIRQGTYRALYSVDDSQKTVLIIRIAHRREAYR